MPSVRQFLRDVRAVNLGDPGRRDDAGRPLPDAPRRYIDSRLIPVFADALGALASTQKIAFYDFDDDSPQMRAVRAAMPPDWSGEFYPENMGGVLYDLWLRDPDSPVFWDFELSGLVDPSWHSRLKLDVAAKVLGTTEQRGQTSGAPAVNAERQADTA